MLIKTLVMMLYLIFPDIEYRYDINRVSKFYNTNTEYTDIDTFYCYNMGITKFSENFLTITITKNFPENKHQTLTIYFSMEYKSNNRITMTGIY